MCALPVQKTMNMSQSILLKINLSAVKSFLLEDKKGFPTAFFDTLVDNIKLLWRNKQLYMKLIMYVSPDAEHQGWFSQIIYSYF